MRAPQTALNCQVDLGNLAEFFAEVNPSAPEFGDRIAYYCLHDTVQTPLQETYKEYIDCHIDMITHFKTSPSGSHSACCGRSPDV